MCKVLQSFLDTCCAAFITLSSLERVADQLHPRTSSHGQKVQSGCCCQARQTSCPSQTPCFEAVLGVPESEVCSWRSRCAGSWHPLGPCDLESFHCWSPEGIWQKDSINPWRGWPSAQMVRQALPPLLERRLAEENPPGHSQVPMLCQSLQGIYTATPPASHFPSLIR